jgi:hypothetical protein
MNGKIFIRILAGLVLLAAIAGIAFFAFNAGMAQHLELSAGNNSQAPNLNYGMPYNTPYFWHPFPFLGFGCFAPLIAIFLVFLALRSLSFVFWGPRGGHWGHMNRGWHRNGGDENGVPPMFQEWHRRAHGEPASDKQD